MALSDLAWVRFDLSGFCTEVANHSARNRIQLSCFKGKTPVIDTRGDCVEEDSCGKLGVWTQLS